MKIESGRPRGLRVYARYDGRWPTLNVVAAQRWLIVSLASVAVLVFGLLLIHVPGMRSPGVLLTVAVIIAAGAVVTPQAALVAAQGALLGLAVAVVAVALAWMAAGGSWTSGAAPESSPCASPACSRNRSAWTPIRR